MDRNNQVEIHLVSDDREMLKQQIETELRYVKLKEHVK